MADPSSYPLLDAMIERRSRRFARGLHLDGGPLTYRSSSQPSPLSKNEEALLSFAACGITGPALGELPYASGSKPETGGGNIMAQFTGRTVASADALHTVTVFILNDEGTWMLRRPQDYPRTELAVLIASARESRFCELFDQCRVRISEQRAAVPRQIPYVPSFNQWMANAAGTTYFVPVAEQSALYINILLSAFSPDFGYYVLDDRNGFKPAGIGKFARSKGGHLYDNMASGRVATVDILETWLCEFTAIELGGVVQNLALMAQALGLGGFPHFGAHPYAWTQALGFRMEQVPFSRSIGAGPVKSALIRATGNEAMIPTPIGLEHDGKVLLKPFCPPYYRDMREAVLAFLDFKYAAGRGTLRDGGESSGWKDGAGVQAGIVEYKEEAIEAAISYATYIYERYGRFPAKSGPLRTVSNFQAHRLDTAFYERFYKPQALSATQREFATD